MDELIVYLDRWDRGLHRALLLRRRPHLDRFMRWISHLCDPPVALLWGTILLTGILPIPTETARRGAFLLLLSHFLVQLIKRRISRPRPTLPVGLHFFLTPPDRFSFPSGHATAGLALVLPALSMLPVLLASVLLLFGLIIGVSRSYLGVHYPGDVLAGWGIAMLSELLLRWLM